MVLEAMKEPLEKPQFTFNFRRPRRREERVIQLPRVLRLLPNAGPRRGIGRCINAFTCCGLRNKLDRSCYCHPGDRRNTLISRSSENSACSVGPIAPANADRSRDRDAQAPGGGSNTDDGSLIVFKAKDRNKILTPAGGARPPYGCRTVEPTTQPRRGRCSENYQ